MIFLCEHWKEYKSSQLTQVENLYITTKEKCYVLSCSAFDEDPVLCCECSVLESNHEEADTRMLLHAKHAMGTNVNVIIRSPDTDVFILCVAMQKNLGSKDLFFMTGTGNKSRTVHINAVTVAMNEEFCRCLPGFHAFSG